MHGECAREGFHVVDSVCSTVALIRVSHLYRRPVWKVAVLRSVRQENPLGAVVVLSAHLTPFRSLPSTFIVRPDPADADAFCRHRLTTRLGHMKEKIYQTK